MIALTTQAAYFFVDVVGRCVVARGFERRRDDGDCWESVWGATGSRHPGQFPMRHEFAFACWPCGSARGWIWLEGGAVSPYSAAWLALWARAAARASWPRGRFRQGYYVADSATAGRVERAGHARGRGPQQASLVVDSSRRIGPWPVRLKLQGIAPREIDVEKRRNDRVARERGSGPGGWIGKRRPQEAGRWSELNGIRAVREKYSGRPGTAAAIKEGIEIAAGENEDLERRNLALRPWCAPSIGRSGPAVPPPSHCRIVLAEWRRRHEKRFVTCPGRRAGAWRGGNDRYFAICHPTDGGRIREQEEYVLTQFALVPWIWPRTRSSAGGRRQPARHDRRSARRMVTMCAGLGRRVLLLRRCTAGNARPSPQCCTQGARGVIVRRPADLVRPWSCAISSLVSLGLLVGGCYQGIVFLFCLARVSHPGALAGGVEALTAVALAWYRWRRTRKSGRGSHSSPAMIGRTALLATVCCRSSVVAWSWLAFVSCEPYGGGRRAIMETERPVLLRAAPHWTAFLDAPRQLGTHADYPAWCRQRWPRVWSWTGNESTAASALISGAFALDTRRASCLFRGGPASVTNHCGRGGLI